MKVMVVAGARPNFMKVGPILEELQTRAHESVLVHTGQHYDPEMSQKFFEDLGIHEPDHHLGVGSGSHAAQTASVMLEFEPVLEDENPAWVVVVGDVNSTLACSLVVAKLQPALGTRLAHVEAGLRSFNREMPEEINRVVTDQLADVLLAPSCDAVPNLTREGISEDRIEVVGNVMIDTLFSRLEAARKRDVPRRYGLEPEGYGVVTLHRPSNVDHPDALSRVLEGLECIAERLPLVFPVHPRTRERLNECEWRPSDRIKLTPPVGYTEMVGLMDAARCVLTDSGGIQEETTALGVPCITLRRETERPVTLEKGTNRLAPWPLSSAGLLDTFSAAITEDRVRPAESTIEGWDGRAALRIVDRLEDRS